MSLVNRTRNMNRETVFLKTVTITYYRARIMSIDNIRLFNKVVHDLRSYTTFA